MSKDVLRVRATGKGLVQNYERLEAGTNAFIGRKFAERKDAPGQYAFEPSDAIVEVPFRVEYVKAIQTGDLEPADKATADRVGVKWTTTSADAQKGNG